MSSRPEQHGVFYARGYVIVSFKSKADADQVRSRLLEGTTDDLRQLSPLIKAPGGEGELVRRHQAGAQAGDTSCWRMLRRIWTRSGS